MKYVKLVFRHALVFLIALFTTSTLFAQLSSKNTTYQARIIKPDNTPLEDSNVTFSFTILNPAGTCSLYVETFSNIDMTDSGGNVAFTLGTGVSSYISAGHTDMMDIFNNNPTAPFACQGGGTYSPTNYDSRKITMAFQISGLGWQVLPATAINSVPYANYANQASRAVSATFAATATSATSALSLNGYTENDFATSAGLGVCPGGEVLTYTISGFDCIPLASVSGTLNNITVNSPLVKTGTVSSPIISITQAASGTDGYLSSSDFILFSQKLAATSAAITTALGAEALTVSSTINLSGDVTGTTTSNTVALVGGKSAAQVSTSVDDTLAASASAAADTIAKRDGSGNIQFNNLGSNITSANQFRLFNGLNSISFLSPVLASSYTLTFPVSSGAVGQVLTTDGAGILSWSSPSVGSVTNVSATAPLASTGGATPTISISQASPTVDGYLAAVDFTSFLNKVTSVSVTPYLTVTGTVSSPVIDLVDVGPTITSGTQYTKLTVDGKGRVVSGAQLVAADIPNLDTSKLTTGVLPFQRGGTGLNVSGTANQILGMNAAQTALEYKTVSAGANISITNNAGELVITASNPGGTVTNVSATAPLASTGGATPTISISQASTTVDGYLAAVDFTSFLNKVTSVSVTPYLTVTGTVSSPTIDLADVGSTITSGTQYTKLTIDGKGRVVSGAQLVAADIPNLDASKITTGTLAVAQLPSFSGDVSSVSGSNIITVDRIKNISVSLTAIASNQILQYNGSQFVNKQIPSCGVNEYLTFDGTTYSCVTDSGSAGTIASVSGTVNEITVTSGTNAVVSLANNGVVSGTYTKVVVDSKGRVSSGTSLVAQDIIDALTFTPFNANNSGTLPLAGDVTGTLSATVVTQVGGKTSATIAATVDTVAAASSLNVSNTLVRRDGSGNFAASQGTFENSVVIKDGSVGGAISIYAPVGFTGYNLTLPSTSGTVGQVLTTNGVGVLSWTDPNAGSVLSVTGTANEVSVTGSASSPVIGLADNGVTSGTYTKVVVDSKGRVSSGTSLVAADIPNLDTSKLTTGTLPFQRGGTGLNVSGTANQILGMNAAQTALEYKTVSAGANISITNNAGELVITASNPGGTVTNVSATAPLASTGGATPTISISQATSATNGYLSFADWNIFNNKLTTLDLGSVSATGTLAIARLPSLAGDVSSVSGSNNITVNYVGGLSSATIATAITQTASASSLNVSNTIVKRDGSGNFAASRGTFENSVVIKDGSVGGAISIYAPVGFTSYNLTLPNTSGTVGQVLTTNGVGVLSWTDPNAGSVLSVTGTVNEVSVTGSASSPVVGLADNGVTSGTYTKITVDSKGRVSSGTSLVAADIPNLDTSKLTTGTLPFNRGGTGLNVSGTANQILGMNAAQTALEYKTVSAGANISITNNAGELVIAASNPGGTVTNVSATAPLASTGGATPTISISQATSATNGYLSFADWNIFNNKLTTLDLGSVSATGTLAIARLPSLTGDISSVSGSNSITVDRIKNISVSLTAIASNQILQYNGTQFVNKQIPTCGASEYLTFNGTTYSCVTDSGSAGTIASVSGTVNEITVTSGTNAVISLANNGVVSGTYTKIIVDSKGRVSSGTSLVASDIPNLDTTKITSGTFAVARGGTGVNTLAVSGILIGNGANPVNTVSPGSSGTVLTIDSSGTPVWLNPASVGTVTNVSATAPLVSTGGATPTISITQATSTTNGYLAAADWNLFNNKLTTLDLGSVSATGTLAIARLPSLAGDVSSVSGSNNITVDYVGGLSSATIATAITQTTSSSSLNVSNTIVKRDTSGNFAASQGTFENSVVIKDGAVGGAISLYAPTGFTGYNLTLPTTSGTTGQVLTTTGAGVLSWSTPASSGAYVLKTGDSMTGSLSVSGTVSATKIAAGNGAFNAPSITFVNQTNTGLFNSSGNLGFSTAGSLAMTLSAGSLGLNGTYAPYLRLGGGSFGETGPSYSFGGDTDTGMFNPATNSLAFTTSSTERLRIDSAGNVGIGTSSPVATLDVSGTVKFAGSTTPVSGGVLTSDASGNAIWRLPTSVSGTQWTTSGTDIYYSTGNVGIGTSVSAYTLDVSGTSNFNGNLRYSQLSYFGSGMTIGQNIFYNGGNTTGNIIAIQANSITSGNAINVTSTSNSFTNTLIKASYSGTGSGKAADFSITNASATGTALNVSNQGTGYAAVFNGGNVGIGTVSPTATLEVSGTVKFAGSTTPVSGGVLTSDATGLATWRLPSSTSSISLSSLTSATTTNTIDNTNFAQTWGWSTLSTQNALSISASALTTGSLLNLTVSSSALNSTNGLLNIANTGSNTNGTILSVKSNSTAGSGLYVLANGNVGIGDAAPNSDLVVRKNQVGETDIRLSNSDPGGFTNTIQASEVAYFYEAAFGSSRSDIVAGMNMANSVAMISGDGAKMVFGTETAMPLYTVTNGVIATTVDATGRMGIGTSAPVATLEVSGTVKFAGSTTPVSGGVLTSDATGLATWRIPASVSASQWTTSGTSINYITGAVGIGTSTPVKLLEVGNSGSNKPGLNGPSADFFANLSASSDNNHRYVLGLWDNQPTAANAGGGLMMGSTYGSGFYATGAMVKALRKSTSASLNHHMGLYTRSGSEVEERVRITDFGLVGISTQSPSRGLDVLGTSATVSVAGFNSNNVSNTSDVMTIGSLAASGFNLLKVEDTNSGTLGSGITRFVVKAGGAIGIGTSAPTTTLEVSGTVKFAGSTTPVSGGVLTSDATGIATWIMPTSVSGTQWTTSGTDIYYSTGKIGVGTSIPIVPLHVYGPNSTNGIFKVESSNGSQSILTVGTTAANTNLIDMVPSGGSVGIAGGSTAARFNVGTLTAGSVAVAIRGIAGQTGDLLRIDTGIGTTGSALKMTSAGYLGLGTVSPTTTLEVSGTLKFAGSTTPVSGGVLTSDATGVATWRLPSSTSSVPLSSLTSATATNAIDSTNFAQTWGWSTLTTQNALTISASALTTGSLLNLTTPNAAVSSTNGLLYVANTSAGTAGIVARIQSNSTAGSGLTVRADGNVGIGTSSPAHALDVDGNLMVRGTRVYLGHTNAYIWNNSNEIVFATNNIDRMRINSGGNLYVGANDAAVNKIDVRGNMSIGTSYAGSIVAPTNGLLVEGNVGIGTVSPTARLDVSGTVRFAGATTPVSGGVLTSDATGLATWRLPSSAGSPALSSMTAATATNTIDSKNFAQTWGWSSLTTENALTVSASSITTGSLLNLTTPNAAVSSTNGLLYVANTSASTSGVIARIQSNSTAGSGLTVRANGNVGIGTASPNTNLQISAASPNVRLTSSGESGSFAITNSSSFDLMKMSYVTGTGTLNSLTNLSLEAGTASSILFRADGATRMTILPNGSVGIGTGATASATLDVSGTLKFAGSTTPVSGGVLTSDANGIATWRLPSSAGSPALSSMTAATATNTIDSKNFAQTWGWSTLSTQNALSISASALTTGSLLNLTTPNAAVSSTNGLLYVANTSAGTTGIVARIQSNSTAGSGLTVRADGNVGIGTTSPRGSFDLQTNGWAIFGNNANGTTPNFVNDRGVALGWNMSGGSAESNLVYGTNNSNSYFNISSSNSGVINERMRFTASGNVGIATSAPQATLDVSGTINMGGAYYESLGTLGTLACGSTNITGFAQNNYDLTACSSGTTTLNIPTITGWPSGNKIWTVTFYVTGQTSSVFNVTYNSATTDVYWDRNSTGGSGGNNYTGFLINNSTTNMFTCTVVNKGTVKVYCGVSAQY